MNLYSSNKKLELDCLNFFSRFKERKVYVLSVGSTDFMKITNNLKIYIFKSKPRMGKLLEDKLTLNFPFFFCEKIIFNNMILLMKLNFDAIPLIPSVNKLNLKLLEF